MKPTLAMSPELDTPLVARLRRPLTRGGLVSMRLVQRILRRVEWWEARLSLANELLQRRRSRPGFDRGQLPIVHARWVREPDRQKSTVEFAPALARPIAQAVLVPSRLTEGQQRMVQALSVQLQERVLAAGSSPLRDTATVAIPVAKAVEELQVPLVAVTARERARATFSHESERPVVRRGAGPRLTEAPPPSELQRALTVPRSSLQAVRPQVQLPTPAEVPGQRTRPLTAPLGTASYQVAHGPRQSVLPPRVQPRSVPPSAPPMLYAVSQSSPVPGPVDPRAPAGHVAPLERDGAASPRHAPLRVLPEPVPPAPRIDLDDLADKVQRRLMRQLAQERTRRGYPR